MLNDIVPLEYWLPASLRNVSQLPLVFTTPLYTVSKTEWQPTTESPADCVPAFSVVPPLPLRCQQLSGTDSGDGGGEWPDLVLELLHVVGLFEDGQKQTQWLPFGL